MIVKNEASVIRRCLDSVIPVIDSWVIVDTGSTDGTQDIIRSHMSSIPGLLHQSEWRDFAYNRSESLRLARHHAGSEQRSLEGRWLLTIMSVTAVQAACCMRSNSRNGTVTHTQTHPSMQASKASIKACQRSAQQLISQPWQTVVDAVYSCCHRLAHTHCRCMV
jgi:hypothetical protein